MSRTSSAESVHSLKEAFDFISGCCLGAQDGFDPVRIIAYGGDDGGGGEGSGLVIFENADGQFGILEDWEDYSGHG